MRNITLLITALLFISAPVWTQTAGGRSELKSIIPLAEIINSDGTIQTSGEMIGTIDPAGWDMVFGDNGEPRFISADKMSTAEFADTNWDNQFHTPGIDKDVNAIVINGSDIYIGGNFIFINKIAVNFIAKWDGSSWHALGAGMNNSVDALAFDGINLYAGGRFTNAGGVDVGYLAKWDGSAWSSLGGTNGPVYALSYNGTELFAGGQFTTAGTANVNNIARWNGSSWSALGMGTNAAVYALVSSGSNLYVGGDFIAAGGLITNSIARWNGVTWSGLGSGMNNFVRSLALNSGGTELYAGGYFTAAGGASANHVAKWNGTAWSSLGSGVNNTVTAITVSGSNLYAGGNFITAGGSSIYYLARWNGANWSALGSGINGNIRALAFSGTNLYAGGGLTVADGIFVNRLAMWNGSSWTAVGMEPGKGIDNAVYCVESNGNVLYAAGFFYYAGGVFCQNIAQWDGAQWSPLGSGTSNIVFALAVRGNDLFAAGLFRSAGGVNVYYIAKWNGTSWSSIGGFDGAVYALAITPTDLYAGGYFTTTSNGPAQRIARWNGSTWSALGSGTNNQVMALAVSGSNLYVGGSLTTAGGMSANHIAMWNGTSWSTLGNGVDSTVLGIAVIGTDVYAGGIFSNAGEINANRIAKWNGFSWAALGTGTNGYVRTLKVNGNNLYAGGTFTTAGGMEANGIAIWNGTAWRSLASGTNGMVNSITLHNGDIYAGGTFTTAGGKASSQIARWVEMPFTTAPTSLSYGDVYLSTGKVDSVTAYNYSTDTLFVTSVISTDSEFTVLPSSTFILPMESAVFKIRLLPASVGNKSTDIIFNHSRATSPDTVTASGTGIMPQIYSFAPVSGPAGSVIILRGAGFDPVPANNIVCFGTVIAIVNSATPTALSVTVPPGATYSPISVTVNKIAISSSYFYIRSFATGNGLIDTATFQEKVGYPNNGIPFDIAVGDIDGDGKIDIASVSSGTASVFKNSGSAGNIVLSPRIDLAIGDNSRRVILRDFDGDAKPDLAVSRQMSNSLSVFRNTSTTGTITFASRQDFSTISEPVDIAFGDLDGDGKTDIAVAAGSSLNILRNTSSSGNISFASAVQFSTGSGTNGIVIGDFDGDNRPDAAVLSSVTNQVNLLRNTGAPGNLTFAGTVSYPTGTSPYEVSVGDADGDGRLDLFIVSSTGNIVSVHRNVSTIGNILFDAIVDLPGGNGPGYVSNDDLNGDAKPDLIVSNHLDSTISVYHNMSPISYYGGRIDCGTFSNPGSVVSADIDGDGPPDLLVTETYHDSITIFRSRLADTYIISATSVGSGNITPSGVSSVLHGSSRLFTITPNTGYHIDSLIVDGINIGTGSSYTFQNVTFPHTIRAYFSVNSYSLSVIGVNGAVTKSPDIPLYTHGTTVQLNAVPYTGFAFIRWSGDTSGSANPLNLIMDRNKNITAICAIIDTIRTFAFGNGAIIPSGVVHVPRGSDTTFRAVPDFGYHIDSLIVDGLNMGAISEHTFTNVGENHTIAAYFSINYYTLTLHSEHGTVIKNPDLTLYLHGSSVTLTSIPDSLYHFSHWSGDTGGSVNPLNVIMDEDKLITANYEFNTFTITATSGSNGSLLPTGSVAVREGADTTLSIIPDDCFAIDSVFVDGIYIGNPSQYTFSNLRRDHTIHATFVVSEYTITVAQSPNGHIIPGTVRVICGTDQVFLLVPEGAYRVDSIFVDDYFVPDSTTSYTFRNIHSDHAISAVYAFDTTYMDLYRSFLPESLALDMDNNRKINQYVRRKPDKVEFELIIINGLPSVDGFRFIFSQAVQVKHALIRKAETGDAINVHVGPVENERSIAAIFNMPIEPGDTLYMHGFGNKGKILKVNRCYATQNGDKVAPDRRDYVFLTNQPRLPMPNRVNALYESLFLGGFGMDGLLVGKRKYGAADSSKYYAWLQTAKYKDILKTLIKPKYLLMHTGFPRGFDVYSSNGATLVRQQKYLSPEKYNNQLLAEMIALKLNISASKLGITPIGFGELEYYSPGMNPIHGMTVAQIADYGDSLMTGQYRQELKRKVFASESEFNNLYAAIRRINSSFESELDTVGFGRRLEFTGVRSLIFVPYLRKSGLPPVTISPSEIPLYQEPEEFSVQQNYPNPFNPITNIMFDLSAEAFVTLKVYNILGQEVGTLIDHEYMDEGYQETEFNASTLSSGVYLYRIVIETVPDDATSRNRIFTYTRKMMVIK